MASPSSILTGEPHGQRRLEGYSLRLQRVGHDQVTNTHTMRELAVDNIQETDLQLLCLKDEKFNAKKVNSPTMGRKQW